MVHEVSESVRVQVIENRLTAEFVKSIHRVRLPYGGQLSLVRKRLAPVESSVDGDASKTNRPVAVLIHGFGQNRYTWHTPFRSFVNYLAYRGYDVFNLELRGFGRSASLGSPLPEHPDVHFEVDIPAALAEVRRLTGESRVFLVGHSLGGACCYAAAPILKDWIRGLVTIAGLYRFAAVPGWLTWGTHLLTRVGLANLPNRRMFPSKQIGRVIRMAQTVMNSRIFKLVPFQTWYPGTIDKKVLSYINHRAYDVASWGVVAAICWWGRAGSITNRHGQDKLAAFDDLDVPLLVLAGSRDVLIPPSGAKPAFDRSASRDKTFRVFGKKDGGHHWGHVDLILGNDAPAYTWPTVADWMDGR